MGKENKDLVGIELSRNPAIDFKKAISDTLIYDTWEILPHTQTHVLSPLQIFKNFNITPFTILPFTH